MPHSKNSVFLFGTIHHPIPIASLWGCPADQAGDGSSLDSRHELHSTWKPGALQCWQSLLTPAGQPWVCFQIWVWCQHSSDCWHRWGSPHREHNTYHVFIFKVPYKPATKLFYFMWNIFVAGLPIMAQIGWMYAICNLWCKHINRTTNITCDGAQNTSLGMRMTENKHMTMLSYW